VLNLEPHYPASDAAADVAAARLSDGMQNRIFLEPILRGRYPADVLAHLAPRIDLGFLDYGDLETIATPIDVLGVNYYRPTTVAATSSGHCSTTSSGRRATRSGSASFTSTTRRSSGHPSRAPAGMQGSSPRTGSAMASRAPMRSARPTLEQVGEVAGVSRATV